MFIFTELTARLSETMASNRTHLTTMSARISSQFTHSIHDPKQMYSLKETWCVTEEEIRDQWNFEVGLSTEHSPVDTQ